MRNTIVIYIVMGLVFINTVKAQSFIVSAKCGFASVSIDTSALMTVSVENKFNKYLSVGINGKFGSADYTSDDCILNNNLVIETRELDVSNFVYSINVCTKFSFINSNMLVVSVIPEIGFYWTESHPDIYFVDEIYSKVSHKNFDNTYSNRNLAYGFVVEGQYYLNDRLGIVADIGWNNYDIGKSINKIDLAENWNHKIDEETSFLYFEIGFAYRLFGKNFWD
ncbi:MAG: outer membrane beta-barrel protein [Bacteroidales bacterium]|nr:outer membrane beta-barrel protein [Bacteroidales bacterium]